MLEGKASQVLGFCPERFFEQEDAALDDVAFEIINLKPHSDYATILLLHAMDVFKNEKSFKVLQFQTLYFRSKLWLGSLNEAFELAKCLWVSLTRLGDLLDFGQLF